MPALRMSCAISFRDWPAWSAITAMVAAMLTGKRKDIEKTPGKSSSSGTSPREKSEAARAAAELSKRSDIKHLELKVEEMRIIHDSRETSRILQLAIGARRLTWGRPPIPPSILSPG